MILPFYCLPQYNIVIYTTKLINYFKIHTLITKIFANWYANFVKKFHDKLMYLTIEAKQVVCNISICHIKDDIVFN